MATRSASPSPRRLHVSGPDQLFPRRDGDQIASALAASSFKRPDTLTMASCPLSVSQAARSYRLLKKTASASSTGKMNVWDAPKAEKEAEEICAEFGYYRGEIGAIAEDEDDAVVMCDLLEESRYATKR